MANFTQLNLNAKETQREKSTTDGSRQGKITSSRSKSKTAMIAGSAMIAVLSGAVLLGTNGCSKGSSKTAIETPAANNTSDQQLLKAASTSAPSSVTNEPPVKTRKKRRSPVITYKDKTSGISFQYPRNYALKTGDKAKSDWARMGPVPMNFVQNGGVSVAAVEVPRGFFPETNFVSAIFNVSVNRNLSASDCEQFGSPGNEQAGRVPPTKVNIGGVEYNQTEAMADDESKQAEAKYYHLFEGGTCYEFALGLATDGSGEEDGVKPVSHKAVFGKLEKILTSVKIQTEAKPEVAVAPPTHPDDEGH